MNEEKKTYDNSNQLAAWANADGSIFVAGNMNGLDFKMKMFLNEKANETNKQPKWRGKLKSDKQKEPSDL